MDLFLPQERDREDGDGLLSDVGSNLSGLDLDEEEGEQGDAPQDR
jgi:hypothetical protein